MSTVSQRDSRSERRTQSRVAVLLMGRNLLA
jgi:hypothetical protein